MKDETKFILDIKTKDAEIKKDSSKNTGFIIKSPYDSKELKLDPLKEGETYLQKIILDKYPKPEDLTSSKIDTINKLVTKTYASSWFCSRRPRWSHIHIFFLSCRASAAL